MDRFEKARHAEIDYHERLYRETPLFTKGSWLEKPASSIIDAFQIINHKPLKILDLGCGVGRNSIPIAQLCKPGSQIIGVDLLETAIDYLTMNAQHYKVEQMITGFVNDVEYYTIDLNSYDFIICCSCLEHLSTETSFIHKINEIRDATKDNGIVCILLNTDAIEENTETGEITPSLLELNLQSDYAFKLLDDCFNNWKLLKKSSMKQVMKEIKEEKEIILSGNWIAFIVQKQ